MSNSKRMRIISLKKGNKSHLFKLSIGLARREADHDRQRQTGEEQLIAYMFHLCSIIQGQRFSLGTPLDN